jgi:hypothetical protein
MFFSDFLYKSRHDHPNWLVVQILAHLFNIFKIFFFFSCLYALQKLISNRENDPDVT